MMESSEIQLYELIEQRLGEKEATAFVVFIESKIEHGFFETKKTLASKEDIANLKTDIATSKIEILRWVFGFFITLMLAILGLYFKK